MNKIQETIAKVLGIQQSLPYHAGSAYNFDDPDAFGYTPISVSNVEIPLVDQDRMFSVSSFLYKTNPLAKRIIETQRAFIIGPNSAVHIKADDPDVNKVINDFWTDRRNNWRRLLKERVDSLHIYGEALWPAYVNTVNGAVHLGAAHPGIIQAVIPNARNHFEPEVVVIKEGRTVGKFPDTIPSNFSVASISGETIPQQSLQVIKVDTQMSDGNGNKNPKFGYYDGDVFFFAINKPMDTLRGISDIFPVADWIDVFDKFLFNRAQRQEYMNSWLWDIKLDGFNQAQMDEWLAKEILSERKNRSGKYFVHNEKIERKAISPEFFSDDAVADASMFLKMIQAGSGLSSQAFGDPGNMGRENAADMNEFVFHSLQDKQDFVGVCLHDVFDFVVDQAILHKTLDKSKRNTPIHIFLPKISLRDLQRITQSLRNFGIFLNNANRAEIILKLDDDDKRKIKESLLFLLDHITVDAETEMFVDHATGDEMDATLLIESVFAGKD